MTLDPATEATITAGYIRLVQAMLARAVSDLNSSRKWPGAYKWLVNGGACYAEMIGIDREAWIERVRRTKNDNLRRWRDAEHSTDAGR